MTGSTKMTPDECIQHGGHCWTGEQMVLPHNRHHFPETCRHCPARRVSTKKDPYVYEMLEPEPLDHPAIEGEDE